MSQQINLFNPIFLKQKKQFSATAMLQALALVLAGSIAMAAYARLQLSALQSQAEAISVQLSQTKAQLAKVSAEYAPRQKNQALEDELQRVEGEVRSQRRALTIVQRGEFGNADGYAEYMRAFSRQIVDGLWLTGFSISGAGQDIELRGRALQPELVPAYIGRLRQESAMRGKSFANLLMQSPEEEARAQAVKPPQPPVSAPSVQYVEFTLRSSDPVPAGPTDATKSGGVTVR